jgi:hypothetical protein
MFFLDVAQKALVDTRYLVKGSLGPGNVRYEKPRMFTTAWHQWTDRQQQKLEWRNQDQEIVDEKMARSGCVIPMQAGATILEAGQALYNYAKVNPTNWYGNCGEQAYIALWICHTIYNVSPADLYTVSFTKGEFQHTLTMLSLGTDRPSLKWAAVCDPWLNIACYFDEYPNESNNQLRKWTRKCKRLRYGTTGYGIFSSTNWVEPSNEKILGFATEPTIDISTAFSTPDWTR